MSQANLPIDEGATISDQDHHFVAVHEAAHAICHLMFNLPMRAASVIPEPGTLGRVIPKQTWDPDPRVHLILGLEPAVRQRNHDRIIRYLAGDAAEEIAKSQAGIFLTGRVPDSSDYKEASAIAELSSETREEAWALLLWLTHRTRAIVSCLYFRRIQNAVVPRLLEEGDLTSSELVEIIRPVAAHILDISPTTRRGRLRLWLARIARPFRRLIHRLIRRYRWWRTRRERSEPR